MVQNQTITNVSGKKGNIGYIMLLTLVATLGGLLFGYDTAVISGTVGALKHVFITPLYSNAAIVKPVIIEYKAVVSLCYVISIILVSSFLFKLFGAGKGAIYSAILTAVSAYIIYDQFISQPNELTENMANSLNGFIISSALLGCIIGGAMGGYIAETMGRKKGLILAGVMFTISAIGLLFRIH